MTEVDLSGQISSGETKISLAGGESPSFLQSETAASASSCFSTTNLLAAENKAAGTAAGEWISRRRQGLKSWRDFCNTNKFKTPSNVASVGRRLMINVEQFQSNYLCVFIILFVYCMAEWTYVVVDRFGGLLRSYLLYSHEKFGDQSSGDRWTRDFASLSIRRHGRTLVSLVLHRRSWYDDLLGDRIFVIVLHALFYASEPIPGAEFEMEEV